MTNQEQMTLKYLAGLRERIECGAFRIVESRICDRSVDPMTMHLDPRVSTHAMKVAIELDLEWMPVDKRVPLQIKTNV